MSTTTEPRDASARALTKRQREELAKLLRTKRDELHRRRAGAPNEHVLEAEADVMDAATEVTSETEATGIAINDTRLLREIEAALTRMKEGTYGSSEESGEPIPFERLQAIPWARRTAQEEEQREARAR